MRSATEIARVLANVIGMLVAGFILAIMIAECRQIRDTHDAVIRLEEKSK